LSDDYNRIRAAAAFALAQRGEEVLNVAPDATPVLIGALDGNSSRDWGGPHHGLDSDASICGHAARMLAVLSPRLTSLQRQLALTKVEHAIRRYASQPEAYVSFEMMSVPASSALQQTCDRLTQPRDWEVADLLAACAIPARQEQLSPSDSDRRLAEAYARQPDQVIAAAIEAVRTGGRWTAMGAAQWLATLGPAAEKGLPALDAIAGGPLDPYAQDQVSRAGKFIRQSLILMREGDQVASPARTDVAALLRVAAEANIADERRHGLIAAFIEHLDHSDAVVRAGAAEGLALLLPSLEEAASAIPLLERMLDDEAFVEIGIAGPHDCEGRLVYWRRQRCSPRRAAVLALSALGRVPPGDRLLAAMLAEAAHAQAICSTMAEPPRFTVAQWRLAAEAAGGLMIAEPRIRAARQQCLCEPWTGLTGPQVCEAELAEVIRVLSGRLGP
jgi:HEAT repeat protein